MLEMLQKSGHASCFAIFILVIVNHYFLINRMKNIFSSTGDCSNRLNGFIHN